MNRDTICVQGGYTPGNGEPRQIPIIQSTTFKYATSEDSVPFGYEGTLRYIAAIERIISSTTPESIGIMLTPMPWQALR